MLIIIDEIAPKQFKSTVNPMTTSTCGRGEQGERGRRSPAKRPLSGRLSTGPHNIAEDVLQHQLAG
jgi:hypothetical protein